GIEPPPSPKGETVVTIEGASALEYISLQESSEKLIRIKGPLTISAKTSDDFVHRISGDEIIFDREKNIIQAEGNITYIRQGNERNDSFSGDSLIVDLDDYSGFFIDGVYNLEPSSGMDRTVILHFGTLLKRANDIMIMEAGRITACDEPSPHYHLSARKVWLFENGDWAFSGATLYIGAVPVLWLPFIYYPSDELVFHPVMGYRSREGAFVQTTTYFLGSRKSDDQSSKSMSFMSTSNSGPAETKGVFIRRRIFDDSPQQGSSTASSENTLKLMADAYSSLGAYIGMKGEFPFSSSNSLSFQVGIGLSRSIFYESTGAYSPFDSVNDYASIWNSSNFLGFDLPFRFGGTLNYQYQLKKDWGKLSLAIDAPLYSDPYFEQDFYQRTEPGTMLSAIQTQNTTTTISARSSMNESLKSSLLFKVPQENSGALLSSFQVSRLNAQMLWKSKSQSTSGLSSDEKRILAVDPQRSFFYPDNLKFLDTAMSANGVIASYDRGKEESVDSVVEGRNYSSLNYRLGWTSNASLDLEDKYYSANWLSPEDIDGSLYYFLVAWKAAGRLQSDLNIADDLFVVSNSLEVSSQDQTRPYLYDERTDPETVHPYRLSDYQYKLSTIKATNSLTLSPFSRESIFGNSSLVYALNGTVFQYAYEGLNGTGVDAEPIYDSTWIGWNSDTITGHSLTASFDFAPKNSVHQTLSFSTTIAPLAGEYTASYNIGNKWFQGKLKAIIESDDDDDDDDDSLLSAGIVVGGGELPSLNSEFSWDIDNSTASLSSTTLSYKWAKAGFTAKYAKGYAYEDNTWVLDGTEYFRPYQMAFSLSPSYSFGGENSGQRGSGGSSLEFKASSTLEYTQNFIKFTESSMGASFDLSLTSRQGTSLSFTSQSLNKAAWRYWPGIFPSSEEFNPNDYYKSIFEDLADSLAIWDTSRLKKGLFKLKSLGLSLSQDLHDWNLEAKLGMDPILVTPDSGRPYYQLDFSFSILVTWKDLPELKSSIAYDEGSFSE
ncbi:MAG: hypothetical protein LLF89_10140, partial [Spirochaetaceae bacterium]|nr:hypothetical protein [Spirochaetaceae bacterium]